MRRFAPLFGICVMVCGACPVSSQEAKRSSDSAFAAQPDKPHLVVRVERVTVANMRLNDTLLISLESFGQQIGAFELKFGCDSRYLDIVEVLPGEVPDSCQWEYFRAIPVATDEKGPRQLWKATALAKMSADTTRPHCYGFERTASLVKLIVSNEGVAEVPDHAASIFFYWEDCRDNAVSDALGRSLLVSVNVFDHHDMELPEEDAFPTRAGTPKQCINPNLANRPRRRIEFRNGGVDFKLDIGTAEADTASAEKE